VYIEEKESLLIGAVVQIS